MHLKELEIFGFKSFPEKTNLRFEPGITVVVGPNGCGKSNVLDAIKWALGEQSPKSLRGAKMEDIIFNGTEHHPALSYAEVTLNFSNEDNYLPIDYKEVSIARRLYRSGESQYFINKNIVRLRDILDLFTGTGIGESTYSFVEQGKIEVFLSYKPEDKRQIFDEASGVLKYKERKKETFKKLEETDENLIRLEDIFIEVKRQIRYLERQVEKARQYKELETELLEVEKNIATLQHKDLENKMNKLLEDLNSLKNDEEAKDKGLTDIKDAIENLNITLTALRKTLEEVNSQTISLSTQIENSTSHIDVFHQRIKELETRIANIEQNKKDFQLRRELIEQRVADVEKQFEVIKNSITSADEEIIKLTNENNILEQEIETNNTKIKEEKTKIFQFEGKRVSLANQVIEIQTNLASLSNRKKRLFLDKARLENLLAERKENLQSVESDLKTTESNLLILREKKSGLVSKTQNLENLKETLRTTLNDKEKEAVELASYYDFLKDFRVKFDTFSVKKNITIIFDEEPKNINKLVASLKDIRIEQDGSVYKARLEAKIISHEEDQLKDRLELIQKEIEQIRQQIEEISREREKLAAEVSQENTHIEQVNARLQERLKEKETVERECTRLGEEFSLIEQELNSTLQDITDLETQQKNTQEELTIHEQNIQTAETTLQTAQETIARNSEKIKEITVEIAKKETFKQSIDNELEALKSKITLIEEEKTGIIKSLEVIEKEKIDATAKIASFTQEISLLTTKIGSDKLKIIECSNKKENLEKEEKDFLEKMEDSRKNEQLLQKECDAVKSAVYNKKLDIQGLEYEKEKIKDYINQVYKIEFTPVAIEQITDTIDTLTARKDKIKNRLDSLGEVNMVAIDEFQELKKREEFLQKQKDDLNTAKEELKKAMLKINRASKELFLETFTKIEEEFKKNFRFLFNGGKAQLILLDPENILESGVEIEVQPPGKKLQNVSLLSGGEKTLTAISLIFAIFRVKPSPLCVLDEIDAPLDEANVDRFNNILKEFSATSQFVLITHNKKTMSMADVLYGVTMQEKGVSKLVSVRFAGEEVAADATPASTATPDTQSTNDATPATSTPTTADDTQMADSK